MPKSKSELQTSDKARRRASLFWNIVLALAALACMIVAAMFPLIANATTVRPPPALLTQLTRITKEDNTTKNTDKEKQRRQHQKREEQGENAAKAQLPVASASKWMTAAL